jgi:hypothetical protein
LVGPGLFLALILLGAAARAETPVGLDAKGVDPMAAVNNRDRLDVRDALGRPVSAKVVLEQLKKAEAARSAQNAYSSVLPKAKTVLPALELAASLGVWLVQLADPAAPSQVWAALPLPSPKAAYVLRRPGARRGRLPAADAGVLSHSPQALS